MKKYIIILVLLLLLTSCNKEEQSDFTKSPARTEVSYQSPPDWLIGTWINHTIQFGIMKFEFTKHNVFLDDKSMSNMVYFSLEIIENDHGRPSYLLGTSDTSAYFKFIEISDRQLFFINKINNEYTSAYLYSEFRMEK